MALIECKPRFRDNIRFVGGLAAKRIGGGYAERAFDAVFSWRGSGRMPYCYDRW